MKCRLLSIALALTALLMVVCQEKSNNPPPQLSSSSVVGNWQGILPAMPPLLADSVRIRADISPDYSFVLSTQYATSGDTTLRYLGLWSERNDTILLSGTNCAIFDTAMNSLVPIACAPAAIPIAITTADNQDVWNIAIKDLLPVAVGMGVDTTLLAAPGIRDIPIPLYRLP